MSGEAGDPGLGENRLAELGARTQTLQPLGTGCARLLTDVPRRGPWTLHMAAATGQVAAAAQELHLPLLPFSLISTRERPHFPHREP